MSIQTTFHAGLLNAGLPVPHGLLGLDAQPAGKRYDVYRNNVTHSLIEAMKTAFPLVQRLIGTQNFDGLAAMFVRGHPPQSPLMMFYGTEFPDFLASFEPLAHIGYLPDAARLDLGLRRSYHAADCTALTAERLQALPAETLETAALPCAPATIILRSDWPLFDIWYFNAVEGAPQPRALAQDVLITRPEFDPAPHALPAGAATWLEALNSGQPLDAASQTAAAADPDFDLTTCLTCALETHALTAPLI